RLKYSVRLRPGPSGPNWRGSGPCERVMKPMKLACAFTPAAKNLSRLFSIVAFAGLLGIAAASPLQAADSEGMPMQNPAGIAALTPDGGSAAQDAQGIAAIVNDHIISRYDLDQRVKLVMVTSGIPDNPETVNRIRGQVLRG